jgi:phospholipid transport system substrate-binding protein
MGRSTNSSGQVGEQRIRQSEEGDGAMMVRRNVWESERGSHWRTLLLVAALAVGLTASPSYAGVPTDAMKATIDEVLRIVRDKELKQPEKTEERRHLLEKVVTARFDYAEMSRRALGAPWNQLTDQQKQEFVDLFRTLLTNSYADKIETYSGEGVQYLNERTEKEYAEVRTKVLSGKTEIPLDYRLINKADDWRVYDVVVDGVSLVNNYRGQFTKILRASSYSDLVDQLRKKSDKLKAP